MKAHRVLGCEGGTRVDLLYGAKPGGAERFVVLEVNTLPGMTPLSLFPEIAKGTGLDFPHLVERILGGSRVEDSDEGPVSQGAGRVLSLNGKHGTPRSNSGKTKNPPEQKASEYLAELLRAAIGARRPRAGHDGKPGPSRLLDVSVFPARSRFSTWARFASWAV